jgi:alkylmercury lyase
MPQDKRELEDLANSLANAFPKLTPVEGRVAVELLRQFVVTGEPVFPTKIAHALDLQGSEVEEILAGWVDWGTVHYSADHRIVAARGLGLYKSSHRFEVDGRILYTWCALDTFYIADLLGSTARIESTCPVTNERISFVLGPDGVTNVVPANTVVSVIVPERPMTTDVRLNFCRFVHFFASEDAGARWISEQNGTFVLLSLKEAFVLMHMVDKTYFGEVLGERPSICG